MQSNYDITSIYTDRIFEFLDRAQSDGVLPIEYIIRISNKDGSILPITNDGNKDYHWSDILTYLENFPDLDLNTVSSISKLTNIKPEEIIRGYIALDEEAFLTKTNARQLLDVIDAQAELSLDILNRKIEPWVEDYLYTARVESRIYSKYPIMIETLNSLQVDEAVSEAEIISQNITYEFKTDISPVELFNNSQLNAYVPYMSINNNGDMFYKIFYDPGLGLDKAYYNNITDRSRKLTTNGMLMLLIWRKGEDFKNPTKDSLIQVLIHNNTISMRYDNKGEISDILDDIKRALNISITNEIIGSSNISYRIDDVKYNKYIFQILLTTNPILNSLLIMNETNTPGSSKRSQMYQFINMGLTLPIRGETPSMSIRQNGKDIIVTLSDVVGSDIEYYRNLSSKLIAVYVLDSKYIIDTFSMFPWIGVPKDKTKVRKVGKSGSVLSALKSNAPDIFVSSYSKKCQGSDQPTPIPNELVAEYEAQTFSYNKNVWNRQVMKFPEDNPVVNLVCLSDPTTPFPGLFINKLDNKDKYPYLPCCYSTNNFDQRTGTYRHRDMDKTTNRGIVTNKVLTKGGMGTISYRIADLLSSIIPGTYKRIGTVLSSKSIIHTVTYAIDEDYRNAVISGNTLAIQSKEKEFIDHYNNVLNKLGSGILRQELYDYTDEQIKSYINGDPYDYTLMYRMFEEFLGEGYNIFAFTNNVDKDTTTGTPGDMLIPRYKLYHYRVYRPERPTIILFRTWGAESDNLELAQYELIVSSHEDGMIQTTFGPDMTEGLMKYLNEVHKIKVLDKNMDIPNINYEKYFVERGFKIISQFIDTYGKLRALRIEKDDTRLDVLTIPSQPTKYPRFYEITKHTYESIQSLLGTEYRVSENNVWYNIGRYNNAFVLPTSSNINDIIHPIEGGYDASPLIEVDIRSGTFNSTDRLVRLSKISLVLLQVIEWLYNRYDTDFINSNYEEEDIPNRIHSFFNDVIWYTEDEADTSYIYNIDKLQYQLDTTGDIQHSMRQLGTYMPNAVHESKLLVYGPAMKNDIEYFLTRYLRFSRQVQRDNNGKLTNRYRTIYDFSPRTSTLIFSDGDDIRSWVKKIMNQESRISITDRLIAWVGNAEDPELLDINGNVFIIQNVVDNSINNIYTLVRQWRYNKTNMGYIKEPTDITDVKVEVYHVNPYSNVSYVGNLQDGNRDTIQVLEFMRGRFAAMLKID